MAIQNTQTSTAPGVQFPADHWDRVGHLYVPIASYSGAVLKYHGILTKGNQDWLRVKYPDSVTLDSYKGDRVNASDYSVFAG